jgi:hypothetical protein
MYYGYMHECRSGNCFETEGVCVCACMDVCVYGCLCVCVCVRESKIGKERGRIKRQFQRNVSCNSEVTTIVKIVAIKSSQVERNKIYKVETNK